MIPSPSSTDLLASLLRPRQLVHRLHETPARSRQRRPHGTDRQLQRRRNLLIVQSFLPHQQRFAITLAETLKCASRHGGLLRPLQRRRLRLDRFVSPRLFAQQLEMTPPPRVPSRLVAHEIRRHREEPRPFAHDLLLSEGAHERLLGDFLRPVAIAEPPNEIADQRLVIRVKETFDFVQETISVREPWTANR